jgi:hypothetical protein
VFARGARRDAAALAAAAPLAWVAVLLLGVMSVRGPLQLWYQLWTGGVTRNLLVVVFVTAPIASVLAVVVHARASRVGIAAIVAALLTAAGAALLVASLLYPGPERLLGAFNSPLGLAPMTYAVIVGVMTYAGLPDLSPWLHALTALLLLIGLVLGIRSRRQDVPA